MTNFLASDESFCRRIFLPTKFSTDEISTDKVRAKLMKLGYEPRNTPKKPQICPRNKKRIWTIWSSKCQKNKNSWASRNIHKKRVYFLIISCRFSVLLGHCVFDHHDVGHVVETWRRWWRCRRPWCDGNVFDAVEDPQPPCHQRTSTHAPHCSSRSILKCLSTFVYFLGRMFHGSKIILKGLY